MKSDVSENAKHICYMKSDASESAKHIRHIKSDASESAKHIHFMKSEVSESVKNIYFMKSEASESIKNIYFIKSEASESVKNIYFMKSDASESTPGISRAWNGMYQDGSSGRVTEQWPRATDFRYTGETTKRRDVMYHVSTIFFFCFHLTISTRAMEYVFITGTKSTKIITGENQTLKRKCMMSPSCTM
jgi:hypothetical protein